MNEFVSLPLTATQMPEEPIDPGFSMPAPDTMSTPSDNDIDPGFSVIPQVDSMQPGISFVPSVDTVDPGFSVIPPFDSVDPGFSVIPQVYPVVPPFVSSTPSVAPCLFCNNNQWIRGGVRMMNAATGYNPLTIRIDGQTASVGLRFPELTQYRQISQGYHVFTVMGTNGYTYIRKSLYVGDGMATVAIINAPGGLDLTVIEDTACPTSYSTACFRVCNLAYYSGPVNVAMGNVYFNSVNFKSATSFSPFEAGRYSLRVSRSARPELPLVTTPVTLNRQRIYTAYILNWNASPDSIQTLLVEDRRN